WAHLIKLLKEEFLARNYISPTDFALFEQFCSVDAAVEKIIRFYRRYHSMRYVNGKLVIRLMSPLSAEDISKLAGEFHDILLPEGDIIFSGALAAETDDKDVVHLPRLVIDFNRRDFGRL